MNRKDSLFKKGAGKMLTQCQAIEIPINDTHLTGDLTVLPKMKSLIIFVHGSGSSRKSPRNQMVARKLNQSCFGTFLFDLLTEEEALYRKNVFDIEFLTDRLVKVIKWLHQQKDLSKLRLGLFGASTGAAAAIQAADQLYGTDFIYAIVSRGGRPDLAADTLDFVKTPILLIVGGNDSEVLELNRCAQSHLVKSKLSVVPSATHLFEEPGALEEVADQASLWFDQSLKSTGTK